MSSDKFEFLFNNIIIFRIVDVVQDLILGEKTSNASCFVEQMHFILEESL